MKRWFKRYDANGDGVNSYSDDEFVEIVNVGQSPVAMSAVLLQVKASTKFAYPPVCLDPGIAYVVFGGGNIPFPDSFGGAKTAVADAKLGLSNSGSVVSLMLNGEALDSVSYDSEGGKKQSICRYPESW